MGIFNENDRKKGPIYRFCSRFCPESDRLLAIKKGKKYSYQDYRHWPDEERWELIDGEAYNMTPSPSFRHQRIVSLVLNILMNNLKGKPCIPGIAPTDIILSEHDVLQPDVFVVCNKSKITEKNIQGAPDLVIEVLSPSTSLKDKREKKACYEKYGVKEYVIIDPIENYVERFSLEADGTFSKGEVFGPKEVIPLLSLEGIKIPLPEVFELEEEVAEQDVRL